MTLPANSSKDTGMTQAKLTSPQREKVFELYFDQMWEALDALTTTNLVYRETTGRWHCMYCLGKPVVDPFWFHHQNQPECVIVRMQRLRHTLATDARIRNRRAVSNGSV